VLDAYFDRQSDGWHHKRVEKEIAISHQRSKAGATGAQARWQSEDDAPEHGKPDAKEMQKKCPPITNNQPPVASNQEPSPAPAPVKPLSAGKKRPPTDTTAFDEAWSLYPARSGDNPKRQALHAWNAHITAGASATEMTAGVLRYRAHIESEGKLGTEFVMQAKRFFGPDEPFRNAWAPKATLDERNLRAVEEWTPPAPIDLETEDGTFRWWSDDNQVLVHGQGQGLNPGETEEFRDYTARVFAALGPGPWIDEADPEMRARVTYFQRVGVHHGEAPNAKPEPIQRRG
jgi:hypothetical protein